MNLFQWILLAILLIGAVVGLALYVIAQDKKRLDEEIAAQAVEANEDGASRPHTDCPPKSSWLKRYTSGGWRKALLATGLLVLLYFVWEAGSTQEHVRMSGIRNEQLHTVFIPVGETKDAFAYAVYSSGPIDLEHLENCPDVTEITCGDPHHSWEPSYTEIDACDSLFYYVCYDARKNQWGAINTNVPGQVLKVNVNAAKIRVWCQTMNPRYEGYNLRVYQRQGSPHKDPRKRQTLASRAKKK